MPEEKEEKRKDKKDKSKYIKLYVKKEKFEYEQELRTLQVELVKMQNYIKENGLKVLIIAEGRDAAGKGGTIKRITEYLNPRGARTVALLKPSDIEKTQWYFQRYVSHLPSAGELVIFDRSWYNRAGVEPVMGFCTQEQHKDFLREVPIIEEVFKNSGIIMFKFYFAVTKTEQDRRFKEREKDPLKQFKLSPIDKKSQELWDQYTIAKYSMLLSSHTTKCPWTIILSDDKKKARINTIKCILNQMDYPDKIDAKFLKIDEDLVHSGSEEIDLMEKDMKNDKLTQMIG